MISDPRVDRSDLWLLRNVIPKPGNEKLVDALMEKIRSYSVVEYYEWDLKQEIKIYSLLIMTGSDKSTWLRILPEVREITRDRAKMAYAFPLMQAYGAGIANDADRLLKTYSQLTKEDNNSPLLENKTQRNSRREELKSVELGLCALANKSDKILPVIKASALENLRSNGGRIGSQIWHFLFRFDVDIVQLALEYQVNGEQLDNIRSISKNMKSLQEQSRDGTLRSNDSFDSCLQVQH